MPDQINKQEIRQKAKDARLAEQIEDLKAGNGWGSDIILSRYFGVSRQTIWKWAKEGRLPKPHKISGNTTRWRNEEVKESEKEKFLMGVRS